MKVAVCFYGQPRTALYCAPWILEQFNLNSYPGETLLWEKKHHWNSVRTEKYRDDIFVDFFCDFKTESYAANDVGAKKISHNNVFFKELIDIYKPKKISFTPHLIDIKISTSKPFYSKMFSSMCRSVFLKKEYERENNFLYDVVFVYRYDVLIGPAPQSLHYLFHQQGVQPLCIHGGHTSNLRFQRESFRAGFYDFVFWGDSFSIDSLCSTFFRTWATNDFESLKPEFALGPNTYLSLATSDAGLAYQPMNLSTSIVRETANLSIPVFDSYAYHETFWVDNAVSNAVWNQK